MKTSKHTTESIITSCDECYAGREQSFMRETSRRDYFIQSGQHSHGDVAFKRNRTSTSQLAKSWGF